MKKPLIIFAFALFSAVLMAARPASANTAILWMGDEDSDFIHVLSCYGNAGGIDTNFEREGVDIGSADSSTFPPVYACETPAFTSSSVFWIHAAVYANTNSNCNNCEAINILSADGQARILLRQQGAWGYYKLGKRDAANTITDLATMSIGALPQGSLHKIDLYINYSTSGEVALYVDGAQALDYSGDVTTNGVTQLDQIQFLGYQRIWSEVIVATGDTRAMRLARLAPTAAGSTDQWPIGAIGNVTETSMDTNTVDSTPTSGQTQLYTVTPAWAAGSYSVLAVGFDATAQVDTTGPQHIKAVVHTVNGDYPSANLSPTQTVWSPVYTVWSNNPDTGVAWTTSDLSDANFNTGYLSQN
jgi:hypothetical protein